MTVAQVNRVSVPDAPTLTQRRGTLLDAATVTSDFAWLDGFGGLWPSYNSLTFRGVPGSFCAPSTKDLSALAQWVGGFRFAVYGGVTCKAIGLDRAQQKSEVERAFNMGESTGVEKALMLTRFKADSEVIGGVTQTRWGTPTDLTPAGGAVSAKAGISLLEGWMGDKYVGSPTIHIPLTIASMILGVDGMVFDGAVLRTKFGSKVAAGAGYDFPNLSPTGATLLASTSEKWIYATGEVWIGKGDLFVQQALDTSTNDSPVLAERGYIAAVDGPVAAIRVKVE